MTETQTGEIQVIFPSQTQYIHMITTMANNAAVMAGFDRSVAGKVAIACDEAVTNVIRHAYKGNPNQQVRMKFTLDGEALVIEIFHTGTPLNKENIKLPDMDQYLQEKRRGGLGLLLITKFMDEVDYVVGSENCCLLKKYRNTDQKGA
ncbi:MAG: ATP-binding protein [Acidobacteria bacterium]|nr:ATP-binding protein [Acidobacteriota bacterium]MCB9397513.1 ATP-binding protein [Acidobacteriota bacterium]